MTPFLKDSDISLRSYWLTVMRVGIKILIIVVAILIHANYLDLLIILGIIFVSEVYKNIGTKLIIKGYKKEYVGAFIGAMDGALLVFALYFAGALNTDVYLFILCSIGLNTAEYGLISALVEGIVAGFAYAIFIIAVFGYNDPGAFASTYLLRVIALVFLGWLTGWLSNEVNDKEEKLEIVLEDDIHQERLNEMKDTFVTDAAESLKTPIAAIKGYTDLILHGRAGTIDEKMTTYVTNISKNIVKIDSLIDELLHIIELEDDRITLKRKKVALKDFLHLLTDDAEAFSKIYHQTIVFHKKINPDTEIIIDEYRLKIAIKNLLYYIFDLSGTTVTIEFRQHDKMLSILVNAKIKNIQELEIFKKDINAVSYSEKDAILKIYTSKLIIESHDGMIDIKKDDNDILSFYIDIPCIE